MFRSKVFSVLQSINRSSYDIGHRKLLRNTLFSTNALHEDSSGTSNVALNENLANISQQPQTLNETVQKSKTSIENAEISIEASDGSNTSSFPTEPELDKLYKKIEIEMRGNEPAVLRNYGEFVVTVAGHLDITVGRHIAIRKPIFERLTLLKSIHVHKKHRVQYESRTYYRYVDLFNLTGSTADTYLEYIERNLPEGVAMKITKVELQSLPKTVEQAMSSQQ